MNKKEDLKKRIKIMENLIKNYQGYLNELYDELAKLENEDFFKKTEESYKEITPKQKKSNNNFANKLEKDIVDIKGK